MQLMVQLRWRFTQWVWVMCGWVFAALGPFILVANPRGSDALKAWLIGVLLIGSSCYLGVKARREGSRTGFLLKLVVPLTLLGISSFIVLSGFFG
jgi:hypothetical protein